MKFHKVGINQYTGPSFLSEVKDELFFFVFYLNGGLTITSSYELWKPGVSSEQNIKPVIWNTHKKQF